MLPICFTSGINEAGTDEAGRGCLAGPVFAAAVILPEDFSNEYINDSKKLTERRRELLRPIIEEQALAWAVGIVNAQEIDKINILNASILAMHRALDALKVRPGAIIVDGNRFKPYGDIPYHEEYPMYHWNENKGYPTKAHREAIEKYGPTPYHRMTFTLIDPQLKLF